MEPWDHGKDVTCDLSISGLVGILHQPSCKKQIQVQFIIQSGTFLHDMSCNNIAGNLDRISKSEKCKSQLIHIVQTKTDWFQGVDFHSKTCWKTIVFPLANGPRERFVNKNRGSVECCKLAILLRCSL